MPVKTIANYQTIEVLYESAHTQIYRARRLVDDRAVILKLLKSDASSPEQIAHFEREYALTSSISLSGVVVAYGLETAQGQSGIVLEDFGGISIDRLRSSADDCFSGDFDLPRFLKLAAQIAEILGQIHQRDIVHQDINPTNIVLNPQTGQVKLIDWGSAVKLSENSPAFDHSQYAVGTLAYMSPEQTGRTNQAIDHRTDLYALGVTFYELLTGQLPFASTDPLELVHAHIAVQPVSPQVLDSKIPQVLSEIVLKLLSKNAKDRYQSAFGLKFDLDECLRRLVDGQVSTECGTFSDIAPFSLGQRDIADQLELPHRLYGREKDVKTLQTVFERVSAMDKSVTSEIVLVLGDSGVGKTTLVHWAHDLAVGPMHYFVSGKFDPPPQAVPYSAFIQAFGDLFRQLLAEDETQVAVWRERFSTALEPHGSVIARMIPEVELLTGPQPLSSVLSAESQTRFNVAFRKLVRVFSDAECPLVIFLDDLQWADGASLNLFQSLATDQENHFVQIIGACRGECRKDANIPAPSHRLLETLIAVEQAGVLVTRVPLSPLTHPHIAQLIADTFHCDLTRAGPLAEIVLEKTGGNPFFVSEFLKSLDAEGLVSFDRDLVHWQWELERIRARDVTDNVVELLTGRVQRLPAETRHVLSLAACIGTRFDLQTLAALLERPLSQVIAYLEPALKAGLIVPPFPEPLDTLGANSTYQFTHDRVQQATYSLIPTADRSEIHQKIGRWLLRYLPPDEQEKRLFDIVNHLNLGWDRIAEQSERDELAELNVRAGFKAAALLAYERVFDYFEISLGLFAPSGTKSAQEQAWGKQYERVFDLYVMVAEAACFSGNRAKAQQLIDVILQHARSKLDRVRAYQILVDMHMFSGEPTLALQDARSALDLLGIRLPSKPSMFRVLLDLFRTQLVVTWATRGKRLEGLTDWPYTNDPHQVATMCMLSFAGIAAATVDARLSALIAFEQVKLSVMHGHTTWSALAYATYGAILCLSGDIKAGYRWDQVAHSLVERSGGADSNEFLTLFTIGAYINHWQMHIRDTLGSLRRALETGDMLYLGNSMGLYAYHAYFIRDQDLRAVEQDMALGHPILVQAGHTSVLHRYELGWQFCLNLLGDAQDPCLLVGDVYDERERLPVHLEARDRNLVFYLYFFKLVLSYLFQDFAQAVENANVAARYIDAAQGIPLIPAFYFYDSLARLALYPLASPSERKNIRRKVTANQKKMKTWAGFGPANCLHKWHLVEAERLRVLGKDGAARESYDRAITLAREYGYLNEEAVACERAACFYLERKQPRVAQVYLRDAHVACAQWGAMAKIQDLATRYPSYRLGTSRPRSEYGSLLHVLDWVSVLEASQAISSEIALDKLLKRLIRTVIENAGAERGVLILHQDDKWMIEAEGTIDQEMRTGEYSPNRTTPENPAILADQAVQVLVLQSVPVTERAIPISIINYVARVNKAVVLDDAARRGQFMHDPIIRTYQPKSVLCVPLLNQGRLTGMLYLENNLATGVFTPERLQVLDVLATRAAISIENARLYADMEKRVEERTASLAQANEFLEREMAERKQAQRALIQQHRAMAMLEERERLARELHDSLSQVLGYVNLRAQAARELFSSGQAEMGDKAMARLVEVVQDAQVDVWEYILGVKTAIALEQGFILALESYIKRFEEDHGIRVKLTLPDDLTDEAFEFPVQIQLLRIIQEALTNVRKHAGVQSARVIFDVQLELLQVTIQDDGRGFALSVPEKQTGKPSGSLTGRHFGLSVMRERVEEVGGQLHIDAAPDQGTRIVVHIPRHQAPSS